MQSKPTSMYEQFLANNDMKKIRAGMTYGVAGGGYHSQWIVST
jgi:hypothetical protein